MCVYPCSESQLRCKVKVLWSFVLHLQYTSTLLQRCSTPDVCGVLVLGEGLFIFLATGSKFSEPEQRPDYTDGAGRRAVVEESFCIIRSVTDSVIIPRRLTKASRSLKYRSLFLSNDRGSDSGVTKMLPIIATERLNFTHRKLNSSKHNWWNWRRNKASKSWSKAGFWIGQN